MMSFIFEIVYVQDHSMKIIIFIICSSIISTYTLLDDSNTSESIFTSLPNFLNITENSTVYIPCHLQNMENTSTIWYRNGQQIADNRNSASVLPNNIRIENDSLQILNIKRTDGGKYSCEILIFGEENSFKQNHLINVLFPPSVYPEPSTGDIDVELMQGFILICDVVGNPQPRIKWYFENKEMPLRNEYMTIFNVTKAVKQHAGEYRCVADNLIGKPASATFQIRILYYPEVSTEKNWVHSANGLKIELVCEVIANPRPKVDWFHNDYPVNFSSKVSTRIFGNKYFLIIKNMKFSDFGNYSCQGTNFLGRNYKTIEVSGLAHPAVFKSDPRIRTETSYTLIWEVDSYSIIIQYNLRFRKQQRGDADGHWISLIIPSGSTFQSPIQSGMYTLAGLEPGTVYEVVLSSKNEFGWSKPSKIFTFSTLSTEYKDTHQEIDVLPPTTMKSVTVENKMDSTTDVFLQENALWQTDKASKTCNYIPFTVLTIIFYFSFIY